MKTVFKNKKFGFSMVELMITIAIIAILSGFMVVNYRDTQERVKSGKVDNDIANIIDALKLFHKDNGKFPLSGNFSQDEINFFQNNKEELIYYFLKGKYLLEKPLDPWGQPYMMDQEFVYCVKKDKIKDPSGKDVEINKIFKKVRYANETQISDDEAWQNNVVNK